MHHTPGQDCGVACLIDARAASFVEKGRAGRAGSIVRVKPDLGRKAALLSDMGAPATKTIKAITASIASVASKALNDILIE